MRLNTNSSSQEFNTDYKIQHSRNCLNFSFPSLNTQSKEQRSIYLILLLEIWTWCLANIVFRLCVLPFFSSLFGETVYLCLCIKYMFACSNNPFVLWPDNFNCIEMRSSTQELSTSVGYSKLFFDLIRFYFRILISLSLQFELFGAVMTKIELAPLYFWPDIDMKID